MTALEMLWTLRLFETDVEQFLNFIVKQLTHHSRSKRAHAENENLASSIDYFYVYKKVLER